MYMELLQKIILIQNKELFKYFLFKVSLFK